MQIIEDDYNFKRLADVKIAVRLRFGDPIGDPANLIIEEDLSGIDVSFNLDVYDAGVCCGSNPIIDACVPATNTLNDNPISGTLANTNKNISIVDDLGATINPTILNDTKTSLDLEIVGGFVCDPVEITVKDTDNNILSVDSYASGAIADKVIGDGNITNSNTSINISILAEGVEVLPDIINICNTCYILLVASPICLGYVRL